MRLLVIFLLVSVSFFSVKSQESAQYLRNAIRDLRNSKGKQTLRRVDTLEVHTEPETITEPLPTPAAERRNVPPLSLTKGELAALYESAVSKGNTIKLMDTGDDTYVHAAVHHIDDPPDHRDPHNPDDTSGYYYYYYPIKSFLDELSSQPYSGHEHYKPSHDEHISTPKLTPFTTTPKPRLQIHSHTHQHNIKIAPLNVVEEKKEKKALEPLFMAISGFIGMAVMFVLSILVFPRFATKKTTRIVNKKQEKIGDIARIALEAIEGKDCAERFACELGKTARNLNLYENRFVKLIKRMAPASFTRHIDMVGKYTTNRRLKCTAIPCKKKNPPKKKPNGQKKH